MLFKKIGGSILDAWDDLEQRQNQIMKNLRDPEMLQNPIVNARSGTISGKSESKAAFSRRKPCQCCGKSYTAIRPKQRFCSNRCRLLYWAANEVVQEYLAGNADGLGELLRKLKL